MELEFEIQLALLFSMVQMDQNKSSYFLVLLPTLFIILFIIRTIFRNLRTNSPKLPPGPPRLPIIGNLHLMIGKLPHHCFRDLAKTYGPIMCLQLGQVPTFICSTPETAKQVLKTHDHNFANRTRLNSCKLMSYNFINVGLAPYGDYQRQLRKLCTAELLSPMRVRSFKPIREQEIAKMVERATANAGQAISIRELLFDTGLGVLSGAVFGEKTKSHEEFMRLVPAIIELAGGLSLVDLFPSYKLLHYIEGARPNPKKLHQKSDKILENVIMEHKAKRATGLTEGNDFLSVLLDLQEQGELVFPLTTDSIKAIINDMFVGGTDSGTIIAEWAMSALMKNPRVMKKAQAEVRDVFASKGRVEEAGLGDLKYLQLVIKETFRLYPSGPLMAPRENTEKCEINGYEIPAKARMFVNIWAIGRDPDIWTEPEAFFPERFLDSSIDYKGNSFELLPFGAGRRMCVGVSFASLVLELQLASLLYHFDWMLPDGQDPESLDMTEVFNTASIRKDALFLVPTLHHSK